MNDAASNAPSSTAPVGNSTPAQAISTPPKKKVNRKRSGPVPGTRQLPFLDPKLRKSMLDMIAMGGTREYAAHLIRVPYSTMLSWFKKGRDDIEAGIKSHFADLWLDMEKADAEGAQILLRSIKNAGKADWRAAAWILSHKNAAYSDRLKTEVSGPDGGPIETKGQVQVLILPAPEDKPA